ncbi:DUF7504 family protein [Geoglobus acetivorans]|uniref:KaiC-like domain-containing protein n=1 Tax=Geoglobus acetivorans TaxID=565033 RepID=A0ABZ3H4R4_GEOAI|nr:hypothetical protein [Geoglobus acetivorans]
MSELSVNSVKALGNKLFSNIKSEKEVVLLNVAPFLYFKALNEVMRLLTAAGEGIYIALNKPCASLDKQLRKAGIFTENIRYVDCNTRQFGGHELEDPRYVFLDSPNPVQVIVTVDRLLRELNSDFKFVYIDSLSTFTLYKSQESLVKFLRQLTGKTRIHGTFCVITVLENEIDPQHLSQLSLLCDSLIEVR